MLRRLERKVRPSSGWEGGKLGAGSKLFLA